MKLKVSAWLRRNGVPTLKVDGMRLARLYKCARPNGEAHHTSTHQVKYTQGMVASAPDFNTKTQCGGGLHFGGTQDKACDYGCKWEGSRKNHAAARHCVVLVPVDQIVVIDNSKVKAPWCIVRSTKQVKERNK